MLGLRFVRGLSLVVASGGHSSSRCAGLSLSRPLPLWGTGSRCAGSAAVARGPSCPTACGIFPDQGSNPCSLHYQADSQPLRHQGSPGVNFLKVQFGHSPISSNFMLIDIILTFFMNTYPLYSFIAFSIRDKSKDSLLGYLRISVSLQIRVGCKLQRPEKQWVKQDRKIFISSCKSAQRRGVQDCEVGNSGFF